MLPGRVKGNTPLAAAVGRASVLTSDPIVVRSSKNRGAVVAPNTAVPSPTRATTRFLAPNATPGTEEGAAVCVGVGVRDCEGTGELVTGVGGMDGVKDDVGVPAGVVVLAGVVDGGAAETEGEAVDEGVGAVE